MKLSNEHLGILRYTSRVSANGLFCGNSKEMEELCKEGLMESVGKKSFVPEEYFAITRKGVRVSASGKFFI